MTSPLPGLVIWVTGLSGVGKTTIATRLQARLRDVGDRPFLLDGDAVRAAIDDPTTGYDRASRLVNAYRICRMAKLASGQGFTTIVSTISLFHEIHDWNRRELPRYFEVHVTADSDVVRRRDPKRLYAQAQRGDDVSLVGVHQVAEEPQQPDLELVNNGDDPAVPDVVEELVRRVWPLIGRTE